MSVQLGARLFAFTSKANWVARANRIWAQHGVRADDTVCVDRLGRICTMGLHFSVAERDDAYPIEVFMKRPDMPAPDPADSGRNGE